MPGPIQPTGVPKPSQVRQDKTFENPKFLEQFIINLNDSPTETTEQMIKFLIEVNKLKIASQQNRNVAKALKELQAKADKLDNTDISPRVLFNNLEKAKAQFKEDKELSKETEKLAKPA